MPRLALPANHQAPAPAQPLLAAVATQLGVVPNLMKVLANSPAALEGYLALHTALAKGRLPAALRESLALAVAAANHCHYCLAAHTYLGHAVAGLDASTMAAAQLGHAFDLPTQAALRFALRVVAERGRVTDGDLATLRTAGFDDAEVIEIVVHVALNVLTNYVNNVAQTPIDFSPLAA